MDSWWVCVSLLCSIYTLIHIAAANLQLINVTISTGKVAGKRLEVGGKTVDAFLGIPYAEPPIKEQRFRAPVPMHSWNGTFNATTFGFGCYLIPDSSFPGFEGGEMWNPRVNLNETCLNLNVWVPHPRKEDAAVMIWIYGGSFYSGVSSLDVYDGKWLAAEEQVIVVSMNYRLGAFGFLAMGGDFAPGNQGLLDQKLAFQWVQDNIHHFGGNREKVTLWGESAGAASISHHLLSQESRGLFQRAILQSAGSTAPWAYYTQEEGIRRGRALGATFGCDEGLTNEEVVACLREQKYTDILNNMFDSTITRSFLDFPFVPVIDGTFLEEDPSTTLERHTFKEAEILIGTNLNEANFFIVYEVPNLMQTLDTLWTPPEMTRDQFYESLDYVFSTRNKFARDAIAFQYTDWLRPYDPVMLRDAVDYAAGDYFFICSTYDLAKAYATAGNDVYYYRFLERASANPWPEWMGVLHGDEIMYTFGVPLNEGSGYTENEKLLSRKIMRYWANFAKSGNPNKPPKENFVPNWPMYTISEQEFLVLNESICDNVAYTGQGPHANQCAFFSDYLPRLETQTADIREEEVEWKEEFDKWRTEYMVNWKNEFDKYINNKHQKCG